MERLALIKGNVGVESKNYLGFLAICSSVNLYFADFYCNSKEHYVTIVICVKGSDTDMSVI